MANKEALEGMSLRGHERRLEIVARVTAFHDAGCRLRVRERGNVVVDGGADAWSAVEPEGVATIARSRVCGTSRPVAESTGDMPISAVSATSGHPSATHGPVAGRFEPPRQCTIGVRVVSAHGCGGD